MTENPNNPNIYQEESEIDIMEYVKTLLKNWKFIFKCGCIAVAVGLVLVIDLPKTYTSQAILAPEIAQKTGSSSMASLAALAGINMNNAVRTDAVYPDLYPEIVNSIPFKVEMFSIPVSFVRRKEVIQTDLYTYLKEYGKAPWWKKVLNAPMKGLGWVMKQLSKKEAEEGYADIDPTHLTKEQEKIVKALGKSLAINVDKKTYLITLGVSLQDPVIAKQVCDEVIAKLQNYVTHYRTEKARDDVKYYQALTEEAQADYYAMQQRYARYVDSNQGISRQSIRIEQERLQNETNLAFTLYNQTAQQLQLAKAKVQQETPVCLVVEPPVVAITGTPSRAKSLMIIVFLGGMLACAWVLFGDKAKELLREVKEDTAEKK